jgi:hypothetical protein
VIWRVAAIVAVIALTVAVAWDAGERHYRNCVNTAGDRLPASLSSFGYDLPGSNSEERLTSLRRGCSRLPW